MLNLYNIHKSFGDVHVLNGVDVCLEKGRVHTLKGGNGSGKTTLFNIITGFLKPSSGEVKFKDRGIGGQSPHRINRQGIGRTFQDLRLALQMSALENILLAQERRMFAFTTAEQTRQAEAILERVALSHQKDTLTGELSYGQQKLLTLGCCIANNAELLLIDEPVAGIDKDNFKKITALVRELRDSGKTILQIEHHPGYIQETSDRVFWMEGGHLREVAS
jgi:branched-chain amino acid transport system ATP-binding protein